MWLREVLIKQSVSGEGVVDKRMKKELKNTESKNIYRDRD